MTEAHVASRPELEERISEQRRRLAVIYHAHACLRRSLGHEDVADVCPDHAGCDTCRSLEAIAGDDRTILDVAIMLGEEALG